MRKPRPDTIAREHLRHLAHDLRNPLCAVLANLQYAIEQGPGAEGADDALRDALQSCVALERLVSNLDVLGGVRARDLAAVPLLEVARDVVRGERPLAASLDITLRIEEPAAPVAALADPALLRGALLNLVANALQFSPRRQEVVVSIATDGAWTSTSVRDEGGSIPAGLREPALVSAAELRAPEDPQGRRGRGFGLLCAALAVEAQGGELAVAGEGPTSILTLRLRAA